MRMLSCFSWVSLRPHGPYPPGYMGFSRQEYWSGLPCPSPGELPNAGREPESPASPASAGGSFPTSTTWETLLLLSGLPAAEVAEPASVQHSQGPSAAAVADINRSTPALALPASESS